MKDSISRSFLKKSALILATILIPFIILELGLRIFNPSKPREQNGHFSRYDPLLGWSGTPGEKFREYDGHRNVLYVNNSKGYRDIEHDPSSRKPAIVFLGGSYPWGAYVEFDEIFVEVLRHMLTNYEIYNLSFDCYGPDQDLLLFKRWEEQYKGQIKLVILTESYEDIRRVSVNTECDMLKPKFDIVGNKLVLTGMPVTMTSRLLNEKNPDLITRMQVWKKRFKLFLFHSYFLHTLYVRIQERYPDLNLTSKIFEELKKTVEARGAKLVIVFVPSNHDVENPYHSKPYQDKIKPICAKLGIACLDPLPDFRKSGGVTQRKSKGGHWTPFGHKVVAESMYNFLINDVGFKLQPKNIRSN